MKIENQWESDENAEYRMNEKGSGRGLMPTPSVLNSVASGGRRGKIKNGKKRDMVRNFSYIEWYIIKNV